MFKTGFFSTFCGFFLRSDTSKILLTPTVLPAILRSGTCFLCQILDIANDDMHKTVFEFKI